MNTRERVLRALREAAGEPVSGEDLAHRLGVSRVAVGKHVHVLRECGYEITASAGTGYRLLGVPDAPLPSEVRCLLRTDLWTRIEGGGVTESTNDDARVLARAGAPEGVVVLASQQTGGRGRLGRTWESPEGGAYFSAILRPQVTPLQVPSLALAVALGVARGLAGLGIDAGLKWPNDVFVSGRKAAGILLEMAAETDRVNWVVAGVGINVHESELATTRAAFVGDAEEELRVPEVAAAALDGIADAYRVWCREGFSALADEYRARFVLVGQDVTVRDALGTVLGQGMVEGVDDEGRMLVRSPEELLSFTAGEVTLRS